MTNNEAQAKHRLIHFGMLGAILLTASMALTPNVADPDMWGHVQYGRDVLQEGLPKTTTYSYTAIGYPWVNHENLSELIMAVGVDVIGPVGLLIGKCLLGLGILALILFKHRSQQLSLAVICLSILLIATNFTNHWNVRPQLASFFCFALLITLLDYCFTGWQANWHLPWLTKLGRRNGEAVLQDSHPKVRWLWLSLPLFLFWTNAHGGFLAGLAVMCLYLTCRFLELAVNKGWQGAGMMRRLSLMLLVVCLTTLINPYGIGLHRWLTMSLGAPRPEITEWHQLYQFDMHSLAFACLLISIVISLCFSRKALDFTQLVVITAVAWQACQHQRHIPFLAMLFGFWVLPHLQDMWTRFVVKTPADSEPSHITLSNRSIYAGFGILYFLIAALLIPRLTSMPVPKDLYPVSAMQFIQKNELQGRFVVTYNWAQYAIAALATEGNSRVQFDGRYRTCYPQKIVDMHFDFILGLSPKYRHREENSDANTVKVDRVLDYRQPDYVLIDRGQPHASQIMNTSKDQWSLVYQDSLSQIWGRADQVDQVTSVKYIPDSQREISDTQQIGSVEWPATQLPSQQQVQLVKH